jgi:UDP-N-acetylmuramoylalanine--D-glutamate ligase
MRYLVLGSSLRGLADAARLALADGAEVALFDAEHPGAPDDLGGRVTVVRPPWSTDVLSEVDRVITSPWFAETRSPLADILDAGIDVITEAGFGLEHLDLPVVGITGTNGKTTVTEATTAMLEGSGIAALAAGNIGRPVSALRQGDAEVLVLELSSYQLRFMGSFDPAACAILNLAADHLDWHGSMEAYIEAKARIFADAGPEAVLAYNADDAIVSALASAASCRTVACSGVSLPPGGNGVTGDEIIIEGRAFNAAHIDETYRFNLVVASTLARALGATNDAVGAVIESFVPGPHRREFVGTVGGVAFINDSKATNPHATVAAVAAFPSVILLAGGRNKGLDLSPLANAEPVKAMVTFGESGRDIAALSTGRAAYAGNLDDAFRVAIEIADPGDTILLSPGCASFDEFSSYEDRGRHFKDLVATLDGAA